MTRVVGADGCPDGWVAVRYDGGAFADVVQHDDVASLWAANDDADTVLLDVPVGLREESAEPRPCDAAARDALGWPRSASVFAPPVREAVHADSYAAAKRIQEERTDGSLGRQAYNITHLVAEVDDLLAETPAARGTIREAHPEVCFAALAGEVAGDGDGDFRPMQFSKTGQPAQAFWERLGVLEAVDERVPADVRAAGESLAGLGRELACSNDDLLDAFALAVTASDLTGELRRLGVGAGESPDPRGLPMEMVYAGV